MYADYTDYMTMYGRERLKEVDFPRLSYKAEVYMDQYTTGIDNVRKLKKAFPTDEDAVKRVKACFCELVDTLYEVSEAERMASLARGYQVTDDGMRGKVISSRSAGNESISYATSGSNTSTTALDRAVSDPQELLALIHRTIRTYLSGVTDANGVNLLYMGRYPAGFEV